MAALSRQPQNVNALDNSKFKFVLTRAPNVEFFLQRAEIPNFSLAPINYPTPFVNIPIPGDHIEFSPLDITFRVDEDMRNYEEIANWIFALGFPNNYGEYASIDRQTMTSGYGKTSDATLMPLTSKLNTNVSFVFTDLWPTALTTIDLNMLTGDIEYAEATVSFMYKSFRIDRKSS